MPAFARPKPSGSPPFDRSLTGTTEQCLLWLLGLNRVPLMFNFGAVFFHVLLGAVALVFPLLLALGRE